MFIIRGLGKYKLIINIFNKMRKNKVLDFLKNFFIDNVDCIFCFEICYFLLK